MVRYPTIVIGMITLGIVGYSTSALVRIAGNYFDALANPRACAWSAMMFTRLMPVPVTASRSSGAISIDQVVKVYDSGGAAVLAVDHCSLEIEAGEICMIVGPSAVARQRCLTRSPVFHEITSGRILLDGAVLCSTERPKAEPGSDRIVVFQNGALFPWKDQLGQCRLRPCRAGSVEPRQARQKARSMMAECRSVGRRTELSG